MLIEAIRSLEATGLGRTEQIAVDHFKKKPDGRGFFAVAEILAKYQRVDEAIQLLMQGLERHPHYSVARVYLAFLLFNRQFFREAWTVLESTPASLRTNLTAQVLRLKLCVVLNFETQARGLARELANQEFQDSEAQIIIKQIDIKSFVQLREDYAQHLGWPVLQAQDSGSAPRSAPPSEIEYAHAKPVAETQPAPSSIPSSWAGGLAKESLNDNADFRRRVAGGFFSSPLVELFVKNQGNQADPGSLDELTRARLMRRQGLYQKAFDIYERLVYSSPGNELLRREFGEIRDLRDAQKEIDQKLDPELVKAMDRVRAIDKQIQVLHQLMGRLNEYEAAS